MSEEMMVMSQDHAKTKRWFRIYQIVTEDKGPEALTEEQRELAAEILLAVSADPHQLPDEELVEVRALKAAWNWFESEYPELLNC